VKTHDEKWNQELEAMLSAPTPYLEDRGFTAQVVARLPAQSSSKRRYVVLAAFTVLAGITAFLLPIGTFVPETLHSASTVPTSLSMLPVASWVLIGLMAWAGVGLASAEET
jgi:hypothetical protein